MTSRPHDMPDDDLSRQRRKRDARLLAQTLPDDPSVTVGELVADVLAAAAAAGDDDADGELDVRQYLAERGHEWPTIKTVVDYLERQEAARAVPSSRRRPLP
jgi:hypothetical protein